MAWRLLAWAAGIACRFGDAAEAIEKPSSTRGARATSVRSGARRRPTPARSLGPTNVDEAIDRCEEASSRPAGNRQSEGNVLAVLGGLYAMQGAFDPRARSARAPRAVRGAGPRDGRRPARDGGVEHRAARRRLEAAERELRRSYDALDAVSDGSSRPWLATSRRRSSSTVHFDEIDASNGRDVAADVDVATRHWRCRGDGRGPCGDAEVES